MQIRILGIIEAGFPTATEEDLLDTMSLDEYLIANKEASFVLSMTNDSMKNAGILKGDMILVERGKTPKANDIVIVEMDGEYKIRYYGSNDKTPWKVEAVVTAVIRKY